MKDFELHRIGPKDKLAVKLHYNPSRAELEDLSRRIEAKWGAVVVLGPGADLEISKTGAWLDRALLVVAVGLLALSLLARFAV